MPTSLTLNTSLWNSNGPTVLLDHPSTILWKTENLSPSLVNIFFFFLLKSPTPFPFFSLSWGHCILIFWLLKNNQERNFTSSNYQMWHQSPSECIYLNFCQFFQVDCPCLYIKPHFLLGAKVPFTYLRILLFYVAPFSLPWIINFPFLTNLYE